jgi:phosphoinositide-3-kinase regulatory subunit
MVGRPVLTLALPHRCEVSPCYKPEKSGLPPQRLLDPPAQAVPDLCSLLCLPIMTFSGALP